MTVLQVVVVIAGAVAMVVIGVVFVLCLIYLDGGPRP